MKANNLKNSILRLETLEARQLLSVSPAGNPDDDPLTPALQAQALEAPNLDFAGALDQDTELLTPALATEGGYISDPGKVTIYRNDTPTEYDTFATAASNLQTGDICVLGAGSWDVSAARTKTFAGLYGSEDADKTDIIVTATGSNGTTTFWTQANFTIKNLSFTRTTATSGDSYQNNFSLSGANVTITDCSFSADLNGGKGDKGQANLHLKGANPTITNCTFELSGSAANPANIRMEGDGNITQSTITGCTFTTSASASTDNGATANLILGYGAATGSPVHILNNNNFTTASGVRGDLVNIHCAQANATVNMTLKLDNNVFINEGVTDSSKCLLSAQNHPKILTCGVNYWNGGFPDANAWSGTATGSITHYAYASSQVRDGSGNLTGDKAYYLSPSDKVTVYNDSADYKVRVAAQDTMPTLQNGDIVILGDGWTGSVDTTANITIQPTDATWATRPFLTSLTAGVVTVNRLSIATSGAVQVKGGSTITDINFGTSATLKNLDDRSSAVIASENKGLSFAQCVGYVDFGTAYTYHTDSVSTMLVDDSFTGGTGQNLREGTDIYYYGYNAFNSIDDALNSTTEDITNIYVKDGSYTGATIDEAVAITKASTETAQPTFSGTIDVTATSGAVGLSHLSLTRTGEVTNSGGATVTAQDNYWGANNMTITNVAAKVTGRVDFSDWQNTEGTDATNSVNFADNSTVLVKSDINSAENDLYDGKIYVEGYNIFHTFLVKSDINSAENYLYDGKIYVEGYNIFHTLTGALESDAGNIKLLSGTADTGKITVGRAVSIDLNGFSINTAVEVSASVVFTGPTGSTLNGLSFSGSGASSITGCTLNGDVENSGSGQLTLNDCTINSDAENSGSGQLTLDDCTINSDVTNSGTAHVVISGTTTAAANVTLTNCAFLGNTFTGTISGTNRTTLDGCAAVGPSVITFDNVKLTTSFSINTDNATRTTISNAVINCSVTNSGTGTLVISGNTTAAAVTLKNCEFQSCTFTGTGTGLSSTKIDGGTVSGANSTFSNVTLAGAFRGTGKMTVLTSIVNDPAAQITGVTFAENVTNGHLINCVGAADKTYTNVTFAGTFTGNSAILNGPITATSATLNNVQVGTGTITGGTYNVITKSGTGALTLAHPTLTTDFDGLSATTLSGTITGTSGETLTNVTIANGATLNGNSAILNGTITATGATLKNVQVGTGTINGGTYNGITKFGTDTLTLTSPTFATDFDGTMVGDDYITTLRGFVTVQNGATLKNVKIDTDATIIFSANAAIENVTFDCDVSVNKANVTFTNCTFNGNFATTDAGTYVTVNTSTIAGTTTLDGDYATFTGGTLTGAVSVQAFDAKFDGVTAGSNFTTTATGTKVSIYGNSSIAGNLELNGSVATISGSSVTGKTTINGNGATFSDSTLADLEVNGSGSEIAAITFKNTEADGDMVITGDVTTSGNYITFTGATIGGTGKTVTVNDGSNYVTFTDCAITAAVSVGGYSAKFDSCAITGTLTTTAETGTNLTFENGSSVSGKTTLGANNATFTDSTLADLEVNGIEISFTDTTAAGDMVITGDVTTSGNYITFTGAKIGGTGTKVTVNSDSDNVTFTDCAITAAVTSDGTTTKINKTATGTSSITGDVILNGDSADVDDTTITGKLIVAGVGSTVDNSSVSDTTTVTGASAIFTGGTLTGAVSVQAFSAKFSGVTVGSDFTTTTAASGVNICDGSSITGNVGLKGYASNVANSSIGGTLDINANSATMNRSSVTGKTTITGSYATVEDSTLGELEVTGSGSVDTPITFSAVYGDMVITGDVTTSGNYITFTGAKIGAEESPVVVSISSGSTYVTFTGCGITAAVTSAGTATKISNGEYGQVSFITGDVTLNGANADVDGTTITGKLIVAGENTTVDDSSVSDTTTVTGANACFKGGTLTGAVSVQANVVQFNGVTAGSTFTTSEAGTNVSIYGNSSIAGNTELNGSVATVADSSIGGTLDIKNGGAKMYRSSVTGKTTITGNSALVEDSTLSDLEIQGSEAKFQKNTSSMIITGNVNILGDKSDSITFIGATIGAAASPVEVSISSGSDSVAFRGCAITASTVTTAGANTIFTDMSDEIDGTKVADMTIVATDLKINGLDDKLNNAKITAAVSVGGNLAKFDSCSIRGTLITTATGTNLTFMDGSSVSGTTTLDANGATFTDSTLADLVVNGSGTVDVPITFTDTTAAGEMKITGDVTTLGANITFTGAKIGTAASPVTVSNWGDSDNVTFTDCTIYAAVSVGGDSADFDSCAITGASFIVDGSDIKVHDGTTITANVLIRGDDAVIGTAGNGSDDVTITGTVTASGARADFDWVRITGNTTISGVDATVDNSSVGGTTTVTGANAIFTDSTLDGTVSVEADKAQFNGVTAGSDFITTTDGTNVKVYGDSSIEGDVTLNGATADVDDTTITGYLIVGGVNTTVDNSSVGDTTTVTGANATFTGGTLTGAVSVQADKARFTGVTAGNDFTTTATGTNLTFENGSSVSGTTRLNGDNATFTDSTLAKLEVIGSNITFTDTTGTDGDMVITGDVTTSGANITFTSAKIGTAASPVTLFIWSGSDNVTFTGCTIYATTAVNGDSADFDTCVITGTDFIVGGSGVKVHDGTTITANVLIRGDDAVIGTAGNGSDDVTITGTVTVNGDSADFDWVSISGNMTTGTTADLGTYDNITFGADLQINGTNTRITQCTVAGNTDTGVWVEEDGAWTCVGGSGLTFTDVTFGTADAENVSVTLGGDTVTLTSTTPNATTIYGTLQIGKMKTVDDVIYNKNTANVTLTNITVTGTVQVDYPNDGRINEGGTNKGSENVRGLQARGVTFLGYDAEAGTYALENWDANTMFDAQACTWGVGEKTLEEVAVQVLGWVDFSNWVNGVDTPTILFSNYMPSHWNEYFWPMSAEAAAAYPTGTNIIRENAEGASTAYTIYYANVDSRENKFNVTVGPAFTYLDEAESGVVEAGARIVMFDSVNPAVTTNTLRFDDVRRDADGQEIRNNAGYTTPAYWVDEDGNAILNENDQRIITNETFALYAESFPGESTDAKYVTDNTRLHDEMYSLHNLPYANAVLSESYEFVVWEDGKQVTYYVNMEPKYVAQAENVDFIREGGEFGEGFYVDYDCELSATTGYRIGTIEFWGECTNPEHTEQRRADIVTVEVAEESKNRVSVKRNEDGTWQLIAARSTHTPNEYTVYLLATTIDGHTERLAFSYAIKAREPNMVKFESTSYTDKTGHVDKNISSNTNYVWQFGFYYADGIPATVKEITYERWDGENWVEAKKADGVTDVFSYDELWCKLTCNTDVSGLYRISSTSWSDDRTNDWSIELDITANDQTVTLPGLTQVKNSTTDGDYVEGSWYSTGTFQRTAVISALEFASTTPAKPVVSDTVHFTVTGNETDGWNLVAARTLQAGRYDLQIEGIDVTIYVGYTAPSNITLDGRASLSAFQVQTGHDLANLAFSYDGMAHKEVWTYNPEIGITMTKNADGTYTIHSETEGVYTLTCTLTDMEGNATTAEYTINVSSSVPTINTTTPVVTTPGGSEAINPATTYAAGALVGYLNITGVATEVAFTDDTSFTVRQEGDYWAVYTVTAQTTAAKNVLTVNYKSAAGVEQIPVEITFYTAVAEVADVKLNGISGATSQTGAPELVVNTGAVITVTGFDAAGKAVAAGKVEYSTDGTTWVDVVNNAFTAVAAENIQVRFTNIAGVSGVYNYKITVRTQASHDLIVKADGSELSAYSTYSTSGLVGYINTEYADGDSTLAVLDKETETASGYFRIGEFNSTVGMWEVRAMRSMLVSHKYEIILTGGKTENIPGTVITNAPSVTEIRFTGATKVTGGTDISITSRAYSSNGIEGYIKSWTIEGADGADELTIDAATGIITGAVTADGTYTVTGTPYTGDVVTAELSVSVITATDPIVDANGVKILATKTYSTSSLVGYLNIEGLDAGDTVELQTAGTASTYFRAQYNATLGKWEVRARRSTNTPAKHDINIVVNGVSEKETTIYVAQKPITVVKINSFTPATTFKCRQGDSLPLSSATSTGAQGHASYVYSWDGGTAVTATDDKVNVPVDLTVGAHTCTVTATGVDGTVLEVTFNVTVQAISGDIGFEVTATGTRVSTSKTLGVFDGGATSDVIATDGTDTYFNVVQATGGVYQLRARRSVTISTTGRTVKLLVTHADTTTDTYDLLLKQVSGVIEATLIKTTVVVTP